MRMSKPLIASLLALTVSACGTLNRGVESVHQPVVSRTNYVYDMPGSLTSDDTTRLNDWFDSLNVGYGDRISVDAPSGALGARGEVAALAAQRGLLLDNKAPITPGEILPGNVRVIVTRSKAEVPGCPDWSRESQPDFSGSSMSNFGCATNSNLAAMVANPEDLVRGQASQGSDSQTTTKAIRQYRTTPPTGTKGLEQQDTKEKGSN
jgi:pilus assembly protein CpaD